MRFFLILLLLVAVTQARWLRRGRSSQPKKTGFVGKATEELSTAIFQSYIDDNKNIAFSPLGYSAILAILAEGARGETRKQLATALHLPEDQDFTRNTFKYIMERLNHTNKYKLNQPEFKNFFYIYDNYTIEDNYKEILKDYYLTDVRSVERINMFGINEDDDDEDDKDAIKIVDKKEEQLKTAVPLKTEEIIDLVPPKETTEKQISFALEDNPVEIDATNTAYKPAKNIKEKIKLVKTYSKKEESGEEEETMVAVEARNHAKSLYLSKNNDVLTSISVNSVGKKSSKPSPNTLMLMFNGMYFRGSWKKPFEREEPGVFYLSSEEKKQVTMMKSNAPYKIGWFPELDSEAIELPYDSDRYVLLLIVPRARDGLTRLIADLPGISLSEIQDSLQEEMVNVSIPIFNVRTTTKPVAAFATFGVSGIFSPEANLSGISPVEGLFVQELVQNVEIEVDTANSSTSELTAANPAENLKNLPLVEVKPSRVFSVEHPFIFYVMDQIDNIVVVAGKVTDVQNSRLNNFY